MASNRDVDTEGGVELPGRSMNRFDHLLTALETAA
jgi:hypothetical protein